MSDRIPWWWRNLKPLAIWYSTRILNEVGGLRVTSAWRSRTAQLRLLKTHKGAAVNSGHPLGWCVDFVGTRAKMEEGRRFALEAGARQALIHDAGSGLHLHVDFRGARQP